MKKGRRSMCHFKGNLRTIPLWYVHTFVEYMQSIVFFLLYWENCLFSAHFQQILQKTGSMLSRQLQKCKHLWLELASDFRAILFTRLQRSAFCSQVHCTMKFVYLFNWAEKNANRYMNDKLQEYSEYLNEV